MITRFCAIRSITSSPRSSSERLNIPSSVVIVFSLFRLRRYEKILDPPNNKLGFFINPVNGAIAYTIIFVIAQLLSGRLLRQLFPTMTTAYRFVLSLVVPVDLWLLDLKTGERRAMDEVNSPRAESLHSWTPNSRWFLFTSRRDDGLYTCIYLASLDTNGKSTKPFLLPQRNPKEYYSMSLYSFNTPDFASRRIEPHPHEVARQIKSDKRVH